MGSHSLLQGIFLTQGLNPGLLPCRQIHYCLSHKGSPSPHNRTHQNSVVQEVQCRGHGFNSWWGSWYLACFTANRIKQTHIKQKQCCNKSNKDFKYGRHSKKDPQNTLVTWNYFLMWVWVAKLHAVDWLCFVNGWMGESDSGKRTPDGGGWSTKEQARPTAQAHFRPLLASHLLTCHWVSSEPRGRKVYHVFCGWHSKDIWSRVWIPKAVKDWSQ